MVPGYRLPGWQKGSETSDTLEHQSPKTPVIHCHCVLLLFQQLGCLRRE